MAEVSYAEAMTRRWKEATNVTRCYKYDTVVKQSMPLKTSRYVRSIKFRFVSK